MVGGGCTGGAQRCKAKQGRRGKDGADVWFLSRSSTVLGWRREWMNNSLVTMSARFSVLRNSLRVMPETKAMVRRLEDRVSAFPDPGLYLS